MKMVHYMLTLKKIFPYALIMIHIMMMKIMGLELLVFLYKKIFLMKLYENRDVAFYAHALKEV